MKDTQIYRWIPASEFKFQENTLYFAENREPGLELYKIAVEYVNRMSVNGKEFLKNGKELFWKHLNDWDNLYIQEELPQSIPLTKEVKEDTASWTELRDLWMEHTTLSEDKQGIMELEQFLLGYKHGFIRASQFSTPVPVSEEEKNVYRSDGWDAAIEKIKFHPFWNGVFDGIPEPPNKETYLSSFQTKKP